MASKKSERYFGCHVSSSGGIANAVAAGSRLGVNTIQLHPSPPQRWNSKPYAANFEADFVAGRKGSCVQKVFFHAIYLINLATPNAQHFHLSKMSLQHYLDLSARIGGDGVIVHVGSLKDEPDESVGYKRAAEGINWIMKETSGESRLLLEVAAGSGMVIGDRMEDLAQIYEQVECKERVGFALDTQHMWASGYDLDSNLEAVITDVEKNFGLDKVWAIHLNDSKTEKGSRKDRHENIGDGLIGEKVIKAVFTHKKLASIPFILETPHMKSEETAALEVRKLEAMLA